MYCFSWKEVAWKFLLRSFIGTATPETPVCARKIIFFELVPFFRNWICMLRLSDREEYACMISAARKPCPSPFPLLFENRRIKPLLSSHTIFPLLINYASKLYFRLRGWVALLWILHVETARASCCLRLPMTMTNCLTSRCCNSDRSLLLPLRFISPRHLQTFISYNILL